MEILIVSATPFEIAPLVNYLDQQFESKEENKYTNQNLEVNLLITGVGLSNTSYFLGKYFGKGKIDLAINLGIAGSFNPKLKIGDVVNVASERFADLGVEEVNGLFTDVYELGLIEPNQFPFQNGVMTNPGLSDYSFLPTVKGLSVNKVHGSSQSIQLIKSKYEADIESMEGAAFFQACLLEQIPFLEIRSISNYVEPRNKENWNLPLAIEKLGEVAISILEIFKED